MSADAPQYQHFIPQFILKNFDHPFSCHKAPTNGSKCKKRHHEKGKYPGDRVVNYLELLPQGYKIEELSIRRVCGMDDMYTDQSSQAAFPRELEVKFSKLEGETSLVIRRIISSHQRGEEKFVYLLNQRGSGFFKTYNCNSIDDYKKNDRDLLKELMDRNGIQRPLDLWMSFCTPSNANEEFVLSDTGSHAYEGLTVDFQDKATGEFLRLGPRFHLFAPTSPRLMIVLRSKHLPEPHEDNNSEIKAGRQLYRQIEIDSIHGPGTKSILEDLPAHKAINSGSTLVNGILRKRPGWDGQIRQTDTFSFPFFKISTHHARIMNEQMRYLARLTGLMHAEGRNISLHITNGPINYDLDVESYKSQNNDAARWLECPDTKVDAVQQGSVDPQDHPKNEKSSLKGHLIDLGPTVKHEELSLRISELPTQHPSAKVQETRPIEQLSKMVGIILFLLAVTYMKVFLAQWSEWLLQVSFGINWYELLVTTVILPGSVLYILRWLDWLLKVLFGIRWYHIVIIFLLPVASQADK
ncbi:hypothetical protein DER46DRAFT_639551 [Fusarium sp. MPI-SDFR-AT-0072]|nr:hypothetical protein DER46DRAFT_639551 [Fusarium sp. MPI-SDFR-AT-0072]